MNQQSPMAQNGPKQFHASFPRRSTQYDRRCVQLGELQRGFGSPASKRPVSRTPYGDVGRSPPGATGVGLATPAADPLSGRNGPEHRTQGGPRLTVIRGGVTQRFLPIREPRSDPRIGRVRAGLRTVVLLTVTWPIGLS
jgi:hypothetical protein